ncbi:putative SP-containing membrane protein [Vairimorpha necatrix]|uniref:SP-containing membrane protein n=1 Tax=Vairimorpha necatrix TaxID=6039 RepID=A0AAX4JE38_9MICR
MILILWFLKFVISINDLNEYFDNKNSSLKSKENLFKKINYDLAYLKALYRAIYDVIIKIIYKGDSYLKIKQHNHSEREYFGELGCNKTTERYLPSENINVLMLSHTEQLDSIATEVVPMVELLYLCEVYGEYDKEHDMVILGPDLENIIKDSFEIYKGASLFSRTVKLKQCFDKKFLDRIGCENYFDFNATKETIERSHQKQRGNINDSLLLKNTENYVTSNLTKEIFLQNTSVDVPNTTESDFKLLPYNSTLNGNSADIDVQGSQSGYSLYFRSSYMLFLVLLFFIILVVGIILFYFIRKYKKSKRSYELAPVEAIKLTNITSDQ